MKKIVLISLALVFFFAAAAIPAMAQMPGAIWTTTAGGTAVDGNAYEAKTDVYLNGGPLHGGAVGLPDGCYAVQVTDPSGNVLGTSVGSTNTLPACVSGGRFAQLYQLWAIVVKASDNTVGYDTTGNAGGEYKVWVSSATTFAGSLSKTDNFKVKEVVLPAAVAITGTKFYDANLDGVQDNGEPVIPGWKVLKYPPEPADVTYTATDGQYSFLVPPGSGTYTISEVMASSLWHNTTPVSGSVTVGGTNTPGPDFGNVCVGPGGGLTLGFWSNKNGQKLITSGDLTFLSGLHLVDGDGKAFDPTTATAVHDWLLAGTAVNMANMLSVQLAAMELNVRHGVVQGSSYVYAPGVPGAGTYGFVTISTLMAAAEAELTAHPQTFSGDPSRALQETIKNALDAANNNRTFVQPQPCAFTTPY